jgi:hypothetical protein
LLLAAWLPLLLGGCLEYREVLSLKADGRGSLEARVTLDMGLMEQLSRAVGQEAPALQGPTPDEVRRALTVPGVAVRFLEVEERGSKTRIRLTIGFDDLAALHRVEAFSAQRRIDLYDQGEGRVLVVSRFDPRGVLPLPELASQRPQGAPPLAPQEAGAIEAAVRRLRDGLRFESELRLPGPILASNGRPDLVTPTAHARSWAVDRQRDPRSHASLGREELRMTAVCPRGAFSLAMPLRPAAKQLSLPASLSNGGRAGPPGRGR